MTPDLAAYAGEPATGNVALANGMLLDDGFGGAKPGAIDGDAGDLDSIAPPTVDAGGVDANSAVAPDNGAATTSAFGSGAPLPNIRLE